MFLLTLWGLGLRLKRIRKKLKRVVEKQPFFYRLWFTVDDLHSLQLINFSLIDKFHNLSLLISSPFVYLLVRDYSSFVRHSLDNAWSILGKQAFLSKECPRKVEGMSKESTRKVQERYKED